MSKNNKEEIRDIKKDLRTKVPWIALSLLIPILGWIIIMANGAVTKADGGDRRISAVEGDIKQMRTDIDWIKKSQERLEASIIKVMGNK